MKYVDEEETLSEVLYVQSEKNAGAKKREEKLADKKKNGHVKKAKKSPRRDFYDIDEDYDAYLRGMYR